MCFDAKSWTVQAAAEVLCKHRESRAVMVAAVVYRAAHIRCSRPDQRAVREVWRHYAALRGLSTDEGERLPAPLEHERRDKQARR